MKNEIAKKLFVIRKILSGLATCQPFLFNTLLQLRETFTGHSRRQVAVSSASYCYAIWMRHLVQWHENGLEKFPGAIAEIGPGNSLGVGLAALLSGVERYYALDAVVHVNPDANKRIFEELIELFSTRASIPDDEACADLAFPLPSLRFPDHILPHAHLTGSLETSRLERIREDILNMSSLAEDNMLRYLTPWMKTLPNDVVGTLDGMLSQFVMEHVDDLDDAYVKFHHLLKTGGIMSHHIDFRSHWTSYEWNGYWSYEDMTWRLIRGRRPYFINRVPLSGHLAAMRKAGFEVLRVMKNEAQSNLARRELAERFRDLSEEDLHTMGAMIVARKT